MTSLKAIYSFIVGYYPIILVAIILGTGLFFKLKSLWKGNVIEFLIDVCAEAEKAFGSGTGFLKIRSAYSAFVTAFPILAKIISFEQFSALVDEALAILKEKMATNEKLSDYINAAEIVASSLIDTTNTESEAVSNA